MFILRDGNGCIYPVPRNSIGGVKDPLPAYLPPLKTIGIAVHPVKHNSGLRNKSRLAIGLVVFKVVKLFVIAHNDSIQNSVKVFSLEL